MKNPKGFALLVGLKQVDPSSYNGWTGENGCWGCELDIDNMARILEAQEFDINIIKTKSATHDTILDKLTSIAHTIDENDIFVFYFSGHGGQQIDLDSDELDGRDETLVAYDREIIDDELYQRFKQFPAGTRIVMISDSCNSGTNYKNLRDIPFSKALPIIPFPESYMNREIASFQMIHMGGCRDGSASQGYHGGGAFTMALCKAWANGTFNGAYEDLFEKARKSMWSSQQPQYNEFGQVTEAFRAQRAFTISSQETSDEDRQTVWRAVEIIDRMDILSTSVEEELITAVREVFPPISDEYLSSAEYKPQPWLNQNEAMLIAQDEVDAMAHGTNGTWPVGSQVTKVFPVFIPGQPLPSYYECKVVDANAQDAGYVLVNVDRTDLLVPEAATEGLTTTERYQARLAGKDLQVMRLDWVRSVAVNPGTTNLSSRGVILASEGFVSETTEREHMNLESSLLTDYLEAYQSSTGFLFYDSAALDEYYAELEDEVELIRYKGPRAARARTRTIQASLSNTFSSSGWHTPAWYQFDKPNGYAIGCGNTAWAIAMAYFKQFHNKSQLFGGTNVDTRHMSTEIKDCMTRCAVLCETRDVDNQGLTWPWKMCRGIGYAKEKGYGGSSCNRDRGTEYSKFSKVYNHLRGNKPVILLMHHDGIGVADHYVVIEGALKTQKRRRRKWRNRNVKYLCNFGNSRTRKWICVRDWGANQNKVYSSFSVFLPDVR